ncbi:FHA domain-containing protein [Lutibacter sp. B2]|nr:FHA domain-containing protein [Lutibacter sp. B2]
MFNFLSLIFRYIFIMMIYLFIFGIMRMIYLDISSMKAIIGNHPYLKLINRKDQLPFKVKEVYVLDKETTIGRKNGNEIVIKDPYISNDHVKFYVKEEGVFIEDIDSANGTCLNEERIIDMVMLRNGDRIKIGQVEFLYVDY